MAAGVFGFVIGFVLDWHRGIGRASRLATSLHYKNLGPLGWVCFVKVNSLDCKKYCVNLLSLLQKAT